ncbi:sulfotransferase family 2 domain-containing protein [Thalassococcus lentus]|uniref:Sulfotransferase family 2 domain-containing protein n=1 Tax=Thalassococcus lentus TaxID=1210524 RepID=A0ABT4XQK8_9RHOB|nr:sulfotransferase family 2 domain-containing protein [Thalassococcus lentus]MDA7424236.1 sulfotransferase family 2 domain-containing protein [Thalassococcus lentus]
MIISPGRRFIFVHIPKTGGTSLATALESRAMADDILIGDTPKAQKRKNRLKKLNARGRIWKHSTLADIDGVLSPDEISAMFCFALVRNPWDRLVSYYHWLRTQQFEHPAVALSQALPFDKFLAHPNTMGSLSAWPSERYLTDIGGTLHDGLFIRLEHFASDVAPLEQHLGFALKMPHENRSTHGDFRSYYTDDLADLVSQLCADDIARFDYRFDP